MTEATEHQKTPSRKSMATKKPVATTDAQRRAAVILEVLAGIRTAQEAAQVLKISPNSYYILERKALAGLVAACEPAPRRGPTVDVQRQVDHLERALARCQKECQRQAALVRATQRVVGLPVTPESDAARGNESKSKRSRKGKSDQRKLRRRRQEPRAARAARSLQKKVAQSAPLEVEPTLERASNEESRCLRRGPHHDSSRA